MKVQCKPGSWKCERPPGRSPGGQSWAQLLLQAASLEGASLKPRKVMGTVPGDLQGLAEGSQVQTSRKKGVHCTSKSRRPEAREGPMSRAELCLCLSTCSRSGSGRNESHHCGPQSRPSPPSKEGLPSPAPVLSQQPAPPPAAGIIF